LMDCEQIAFGTYSPVEGFFTKKELTSVLSNYRLPCGTVWPLPLVLAISDQQRKGLKIGQKVILQSESLTEHAVLEIEDLYQMDLDKMAEAWFGTNSMDHPGVLRLHQQGNNFIGGKIQLVKKLVSSTGQYELTPYQTRFIFKAKGWAKVVGFHTRNIPHRAHEFIQKEALERSFADGLFISPVTGPKKKGDFKGEPILKSYQALIDAGCYPKDKILLGAFPTFSRYSGPREAVFTALCRKNLGCSHFIIGRDHTGVSNFYGPDENFNLFKKLGEIEIEPVFFNIVGYNPEKENYEESTSATKHLENISGTQVRDALKKDNPLPTWFIREEVQNVIREEIQVGKQVFY